MSPKFTPLNTDEKDNFLSITGDSLPKGYQDLKYCKVLKTKFAFYPGWAFYQIQKDDDVNASPISLFIKDKEVVVMDWQTRSILEFNARAPLILDVNEILAYVTFYFYHTRVRDGAFELIQTYEDLKWQEEPSAAIKKALSTILRAPHLIAWNEPGKTYEIGAQILFGTNLFECRLHVYGDGRIEIIDRHLRIEDLPVLDSLIE